MSCAISTNQQKPQMQSTHLSVCRLRGREHGRDTERLERGLLLREQAVPRGQDALAVEPLQLSAERVC